MTHADRVALRSYSDLLESLFKYDKQTLQFLVCKFPHVPETKHVLAVISLHQYQQD